MNIDLDRREWDTVLALMAFAPGNQCIPLINRISQQLQQPQSGIGQQAMSPQRREEMLKEWEEKNKGNSGERLTHRGD